MTTEYATRSNPTGGLGGYLRRITLELARRGHEAHVFYYAHHSPGISIDSGVHIHRLARRRSRGLTWAQKGSRYRIKRMLDALERAYRFRRYLQAVQAQYPLDILQSPNLHVPGLLVDNAAPLVIRCSSYRPVWDKYDHGQMNLDGRMLQSMEALQYRRASGVFAPTKLLAGVLREELGLADATVIRSPFYTEVAEMDESLYQNELGGRNYLLFFGRLSPLKGAHILAQALPRVWKQYPDLMAVFIGKEGKLDRTTKMEDFIKAQCAEFERNVRLIPPLAHQALYPFILHARLVVLPSLFDNAPNALLESMGFARPVIGTYGSSMDEFIEDGVSGFLVNAGDADELAARICEAWERPDLDEIGGAARRVIDGLNSEDIVGQLVDFYQEQIDVGRRR